MQLRLILMDRRRRVRLRMTVNLDDVRSDAVTLGWRRLLLLLLLPWCEMLHVVLTSKRDVSTRSRRGSDRWMECWCSWNTTREGLTVR